MVEQFFHVGIAVIDLEKCKSFFCDIFDYQVELEFDTDSRKTYGVPNAFLRVAFLKGPGGQIELLKNIHPNFTPAPPVGRVAPISHFALYVKDLESIIEKVKAAGYEVWTEGIRVAPDNHPIIPGCRGVYICGPENIVVEIIERPKKQSGRRSKLV